MNLTFREAEWYPVSKIEHPKDTFRAQYISTQTHIYISITENHITILGSEQKLQTQNQTSIFITNNQITYF